MNRVFMLVLLLVIHGCGGYEGNNVPPATPQPIPTPGPSPDPGNGTKPGFAEAQTIMQQYCAECHAGAAFTRSEAGLRGSSAKSRVQNATMPPPYATQLPAAEKQRFLNFF